MASRPTRSLRAIPVAFGLALSVSGSLASQGRPLSVTGRNDLAFGPLFPGITAQVSRTDVARAGHLEIRGLKDAEVQIVLTLPTALVDGGGRTVPLQFLGGDGGYSMNNAITAATAFDPRTPLVTRLSNNGRLYLWLGGRALPGPTQPAGSYAGGISVSVTYTGA